MQLIQRYKAKYGEEKGVDGLQQSEMKIPWNHSFYNNPYDTK